MNSNYGGSVYDNLMYGANNLNGWLSTVKNNNNGLFEGMNQSLSDQMNHKNNMDRYVQNEQLQKMMDQGRMNPQNEDQPSLLCLMQQIELYKELLAQVTYQNQLLSRDISIKQPPMGSFGGMPMNYHMPQQMPMNYNPMAPHPMMMMGMNPMMGREKEQPLQPNAREALVMPSKEVPGMQTNNY